MDSFGALIGSIIASLVLLLFAIVSLFVTVFIVQAGAGLAGYSPSGDFAPTARDERKIGREMVDQNTGLGSVMAHAYRGEMDEATT